MRRATKPRATVSIPKPSRSLAAEPSELAEMWKPMATVQLGRRMDPAVAYSVCLAGAVVSLAGELEALRERIAELEADRPQPRRAAR